MGYSAVADGMIYLKGTDKQQDNETIKFIHDNIAELTDVYHHEGGDTCVYFCGSSYEYDNKKCKTLYEMLKERCIEGHVDFRGEDGRLWCHHYNTKKGIWSEHKGKIVYEGIDTI